MKTRKRAVIGEQRELGGRMYIKTSSGWKYIGKGKGSKAKQYIDSHKESSITHQERLQYPKSWSDKDIMDSKNRMEEFRKKVKEQQKNNHDQSSTELDRLRSIPRSKRTEAQDKAIKDLTLKIGEIENPQNSSSEEKSVKKKAELGEERIFGDRAYVKTSQGWKYVSKGGKKAQEHKAMLNNFPAKQHIDSHKESFKSKNPSFDNLTQDEKYRVFESLPFVDARKIKVGDIHRYEEDGDIKTSIVKKNQAVN